jgi:hypothetical protein
MRVKSPDREWCKSQFTLTFFFFKNCEQALVTVLMPQQIYLRQQQISIVSKVIFWGFFDA